jgi:hypothetical protein
MLIMGSVMALRMRIFFQTKTDRRHAYVIHSAMLFFLLQAPEWFQFIDR